MPQTIIQGEYYFRKTEMVSGFKFSADGTFQFFFSYGAVDRRATGTFSVEGDAIKLKSDKEAGKDFTVTSQSEQGDGYILKFSHPNPFLLNYIRCIFQADGKSTETVSDSRGEVRVDLRNCDSIYAQHLLYPDIATLVKDPENGNNSFELALNPSLEQLSFRGIDLTIESDGSLSWLPNYFLELPGIRFIKKRQQD